MYEIKRSKKFKKSYKRVSQHPTFDRATFIAVVDKLAAGKTLDNKYRDHALIGDMRAYRECHLAPDLLLIYHIDSGILTLTLVNIGSHSQLFKK